MSQHHASTQPRQSQQYGTGQRGANQQSLQQQPQHDQAQSVQTGQARQPSQQLEQQTPQRLGGQQGGQQGQMAEQSQQASGQLQQEPIFQTANFLPEEVRSTSVEVCNQVLADAVVVLSQLKGAHWNVRGPDFYQLHELFDDLADSLESYVDEIAERVTALGGLARGTVYQAAQQSTLPPLPERAVEGHQLLQHVAQALSAFDATLYQGMETIEQVEDLDTIDLLNEVSRDVSKSLWFVEAHLQGEQAQQIAGQSRP